MHDPASVILAAPHHEASHPHDPALEHSADSAWEFDHLELRTVGIDIGSATSHVMFAQVTLVRQGDSLSNRYTVASRRTLYQAPTLLTPYLDDNRIDADVLEQHINGSYRAAGLEPSDLETGAVILTGNALERRNAQAIAELFAQEGGKFVCASAGHHLEALLAAHGSGAVSRSRAAARSVLNVDVGGGTTKYSAIQGGEVVGTVAIAGGGRIVAWDESGRLTRIESAAAVLADEAGVALQLSGHLAPADRETLATHLAERITRWCTPRGWTEERLAGSIPAEFQPDEIILSGGVGGIVGDSYAALNKDLYGDLGPYLAVALSQRLPSLRVPISVADQPMHATVVGASQFTVQVSGGTIHVSDDATLPLRNLPVAVVRLDSMPEPSVQDVEHEIAATVRRLESLDGGNTIALFLLWDGVPRYRVLATLATAIQNQHLNAPRARSPLVVAATADIAANLGRILTHDLQHPSDVVVIDGIDLIDLDYLDIGEAIGPANVVPVIIKSLLFSPEHAARPLRVGAQPHSAPATPS